MGRIEVCVPSYRRPGRVKTLERVYDRAKVYVDSSEAGAYADANPGARIVVLPDGVQGNIARVRNYILDSEFGSGADAVCMMDDDISVFGRFLGDERHFGYVRRVLSGDGFEEFLCDHTSLCEDIGLTLWGVNLMNSNRAYHQGRPFSLTNPVLGPFCVHLRNPIRYDERIPLKEDYDMFLQHMSAERGVLRLNGHWYENSGSNCAEGGCGTQRNTQEERRQFEILRGKWGGQVVRRDNGSKRGFDFNPIVKVPIQGV